MQSVIDYGRVHSAQKMPDGSLRAYVRVAAANRPYLYRNKDGSTRTEKITPDELFKPSSVDGLKIQTITYPHAPGLVTPDNYQSVAAGSTGNLIVAGLDGDFLGVMASIRRRDAIDAFDAGIREFSPGYFRDLTTDGFQTNRQYYELALVDRARGGRDCCAKDSADDYLTFDPSQIDESFTKFWTADSAGFDNNAIDRLILHGTLSPPPIILPMYTKITVGDTQLEVNPTCIDAASKLNTRVAQLEATVAQSAKLNQDSIEQSATIAALTAKNADLQKLTDSLETQVRDGVALMIKDIANANAEIGVFASGKVDTTTAKACLDAHDIDGYRSAIVTAITKKPVTDTATLTTQYDSCLKVFQFQGYKAADGMTTYTMPPQLQQLNAMGGSSTIINSTISSEGVPGFSGETSVIQGQRGGNYAAGLPPLDNNWRTI